MQRRVVQREPPAAPLKCVLCGFKTRTLAFLKVKTWGGYGCNCHLLGYGLDLYTSLSLANSLQPATHEFSSLCGLTLPYPGSHRLWIPLLFGCQGQKTQTVCALLWLDSQIYSRQSLRENHTPFFFQLHRFSFALLFQKRIPLFVLRKIPMCFACIHQKKNLHQYLTWKFPFIRQKDFFAFADGYTFCTKNRTLYSKANIVKHAHSDNA